MHAPTGFDMAFLSILPVVNKISHTGVMGALLFVILYVICLVISKIVIYHIVISNNIKKIKNLRKHISFISVKSVYLTIFKNYFKNTKNTQIPTNVKKICRFYDFVGFSWNGALCSKSRFLV